MKLSETEMAELDVATALVPVYPNWFIQKLADQPLIEAIGKGEKVRD